MEILGYPTLVLMREARSPAVSAPKKAAAAGGKPARSTSSRRKVLDSAPMKAAAAAHIQPQSDGICQSPFHNPD